ncbi:MAG: hypothetical protein MRY32_06510 [Rickettsiales bacterium]|nr:hypothetical protein [Rickettsiales bacterium]
MASVAACTPIVENSQKAAYDVRGRLYYTAERFQNWLSYKPEDTSPTPVEPKYCYNAHSDIICYSEPKPYITNKLVGKQGEVMRLEQSVSAPISQVAVTDMSMDEANLASDKAMTSDTDKLFKSMNENPPRHIMPSY